MPEQREEKVNKETIEKHLELPIEQEPGTKTEAIPSQEIQEMREAIIEEISEVEKPKQTIVKKVVTKDKDKKPKEEIIAKSPTYERIENIMEEGLGEVYLKMTPEQRKTFKEEGERTVYKIEKLLNKTKVKIKEIIKLIREWLKLIPGVNRFFLEQEAKIKSDKILKIKK